MPRGTLSRQQQADNTTGVLGFPSQATKIDAQLQRPRNATPNTRLIFFTTRALCKRQQAEAVPYLPVRDLLARGIVAFQE